MTRTSRGLLIVGLTAAARAIAAASTLVFSPRLRDSLTEAVYDVDGVYATDYSTPKDDDTLLVDDRLDDKKTTFDPALVDSRPLHGWSLNASDAVIRLDVPIIRPDDEPELLVLHPSYSAAVKAARGPVLPSVNMIDGKAKQFDDGLYAAIDQAYFLGHGEAMKSHLKLIRRIFEKVGKGTPAADYLAAGLSLGGEPAETSPGTKAMASAFLAREVWSKPIAFYTWNKTLSDCFRFLRFFAMPIGDPSIPVEIARVLREDKPLRDDYVKAYTFYAGLTNPLVGRTPAGLIDGPPLGPEEQVALFPQSTSRETELFEKLFRRGLPTDANLMRELISAIRSGKVDLKPPKDGGWYDHQVYALEALLLPEKGTESNKLLLTKEYKKRLLEAFKALMTKRRETHARQAKFAGAAERPSLQELSSVRPRLRVEPNPTYFLRTARSYAFLANFLESTLGEETLKSLKGLREGGERGTDLDSELKSMRELFYGLYLLSAEDIGMKPASLEGEGVDAGAARKAAEGWLSGIATDPDLAADTRVAVPLYFDPLKNTVRTWMTIGVRLARLDARYARAPSVRPADGSADWKPVESHKLDSTEYVIPVDEFAEVELKGGRVLDRAELRAACDRLKSKEKIVEALGK